MAPERPPTGRGRTPILHLDEHVVAAAKPSGWLVHRGWARDEVVLMTAVRDQIGQRVYPVHRLDRGTSGVVIFALDSTAAALQAQFRANTVHKRYLALARGVPPPIGTIDHPVPKDPKARGTDKVRLAATTDFTRLAVAGRYALVEARPRTGRVHQIRRHFKHRSWHLIGDVNYGKGEHNRLFRERYDLHRLALHAFELTLCHPATGEPLTLRAPLPADLSAPLRQLGLEPALDEVIETLGIDTTLPRALPAQG